MKSDRRNWCLWAAASLLFLLVGFSAGANVYATDIKLNGSTNNAAIVPAGTVQISYILNEPASAGLCVQILSGASVVWTNALAGGDAGTVAGSNSILWGGTNQAGQKVAAGIYQLSVTAAALGYPAWTNITDDGPNFQMTTPSSITVNKNTNSPYYGRVFVGNNSAEVSTLGIYKCNADGSPADEGGFSAGNYAWNSPYSPGDLYSPWKMAVALDDTVYVNDWGGGDMVLAFDETISNYYPVLDYSSSLFGGGIWMTGGGTNAQLYMADADYTGNSEGVLQWELTNGVVAFGDPGAVVVEIDTIGTNGAGVYPWDVSVDAAGNIYAIQNLDGFNYPQYYTSNRVFCFPPYNSNGPPNIDNATWCLNSLDYSLESPLGLAVDPTGLFLAVAVGGTNNGGNEYELTNGSVNIYYTANGGPVARLGIGDEYLDVAWDNAGNLYATDLSDQVWRVYSPPGTNQATTLAVPVIQVYDTLTPPILSAPIAPIAPVSQFGFTLTGQSNVTYLIESSLDLINWTNIAATSYDIVPVRAITVPGTNNACFFRAVITP